MHMNYFILHQMRRKVKMKSNTKKIISIVFMLIGLISCLLYSIYLGAYTDEYNIICYDTSTIIESFFDKYLVLLGIGLVLYFMSDKEVK